MNASEKTRVLLVIDVQTLFLEEEIPAKPELISTIQTVVDRARLAQPLVQVIWVRHRQEPNLVPNTPSWQIISTLIPKPEEPIVDKGQSNSFVETNLKTHLLKAIGQSPGTKFELFITGLQSNFCIRETTLAAIKEFPDAQIVVVKGAHGTSMLDEDERVEVIQEVEQELRAAGALLLEVGELGF